MSSHRSFDPAIEKPDHDGIEEYDHPLPTWWLGILYTTIAFAFFYWITFQVTDAGANPIREYEEAQAELARRLAATKPVTDETLESLAKDPVTLTQGETIFVQNCVQCHGPRGEGTIGPNLTDAYWLHGGRPTDIHKVVSTGVVAKGMLAWAPVLGGERVRAVTAYVLSLRGKNVAGKAPQGAKVP